MLKIFICDNIMYGIKIYLIFNPSLKTEFITCKKVTFAFTFLIITACISQDFLQSLCQSLLKFYCFSYSLIIAIKKKEDLFFNNSGMISIGTWGRPESNRRPTGHYSSKLTSSVSQFSLVYLWSP